MPGPGLSPSQPQMAQLGASDRTHYRKYALPAVLVFIGAKIFVAAFLLDGGKFPPTLSLGVTFALIAAGVGYSLWKTRDPQVSADGSR